MAVRGGGTGLNLVMLGPPGVGKSLQSSRLAHHLRIPRIATGELLRAEVAAGSELGQAVAADLAAGRLVPDELVLDLVRRRLQAEEAARGFVLDGFPRTLSQAQALDRLLARLGRPLSHVLLLVAPDEVVVERLRGRLRCPDCGATFQAGYFPARPGGTCPVCRGALRPTEDGGLRCQPCLRPLEPRPDDRPQVVRARLARYHEEIGPVIEYYRARGLLRPVDATGSGDEVFESLLRAVGEPARSRPPSHR